MLIAGEGVPVSCADYVLSRGLEDVVDLVSSFQRGSNLPKWIEKDVGSDRDFLKGAFEHLWGNCRGHDVRRRYRQMTHHERNNYIPEAAFPDADNGPKVCSVAVPDCLGFTDTSFINCTGHMEMGSLQLSSGHFCGWEEAR